MGNSLQDGIVSVANSNYQKKMKIIEEKDKQKMKLKPVPEGKRGVIYLQCGVKQFLIPWHKFWLSLSSARTEKEPILSLFRI